MQDAGSGHQRSLAQIRTLSPGKVDAQRQLPLLRFPCALNVESIAWGLASTIPLTTGGGGRNRVIFGGPGLRGYRHSAIWPA